MHNRRDFLKKGSVLAATTGMAAFAPLEALTLQMNRKTPPGTPVKISNNHFEIQAVPNSENIHIKVKDIQRNILWADAPYTYRITEKTDEGTKEFSALTSPVITFTPDSLLIRGLLGDFNIEHEITTDQNTPYFTEKMKIISRRGINSCVKEFTTSFCKKITGPDGKIHPCLTQDRFQAVPLLHRADDPANSSGADYSLQQIVAGNGFVFQASDVFTGPKRLASRSFISEGWGWRHGNAILGIFSFNQDNMIFSTLSGDEHGLLHFGGFKKEGLNLSVMERFEPASTIYLGMNRFYPLSGGYNQIAYQYRDMLDEMGCRFPKDYSPPIHWNELYNMNNAWNERKKLYTLSNLKNEARKAKAHSCQALYLDPGWDTAFGSFLWGTDRLGDCRSYIRAMEKDYGLKTSLHTPMPPWSSFSPLLMGPSAVKTWPTASRRMLKTSGGTQQGLKDEVNVPAKTGPRLCMGSKQFLDEAEKRLLMLCEAGVTFFMFDGTWWNGPCDDERHDHPIPYLYEDHMDTCIEMARRVHRKYPDVLIEMHDMMNGGASARSTPVYYKYGLAGSYDENWGFELMWHPLEDIKNKSGLALYYYNLGCNIPLYLHIDTGQDNANSIMLWWFASTVRHLGIGGDSPDPQITRQHQQDMKLYLQLQPFYKRGDFYGMNEEIHIHTLAEKQQCVINIFKLSDKPGITTGEISLSEIGLNPEGRYSSNKDWITINHGRMVVRKDMQAWDTDLSVIKPL